MGAPQGRGLPSRPRSTGGRVRERVGIPARHATLQEDTPAQAAAAVAGAATSSGLLSVATQCVNLMKENDKLKAKLAAAREQREAASGDKQRMRGRLELLAGRGALHYYYSDISLLFCLFSDIAHSLGTAVRAETTALRREAEAIRSVVEEARVSHLASIELVKHGVQTLYERQRQEALALREERGRHSARESVERGLTLQEREREAMQGKERLGRLLRLTRERERAKDIQRERDVVAKAFYRWRCRYLVVGREKQRERERREGMGEGGPEGASVQALLKWQAKGLYKALARKSDKNTATILERLEHSEGQGQGHGVGVRPVPRATSADRVVKRLSEPAAARGPNPRQRQRERERERERESDRHGQRNMPLRQSEL
ncbi:hypothetical protein KIPB_007212 [Kipferlia bialata]|uniref:Uncharacterized protein n=1 Tax=Kipferlia bialata TaxID=797122 RepID=A0A391NMS8_9EUKA|nr:hypothetical protein KIPB_007212 [Kipferlia bialata]|eukprot:g7212.t1